MAAALVPEAWARVLDELVRRQALADHDGRNLGDVSAAPADHADCVADP
jgi:hypothetical protein